MQDVSCAIHFLLIYFPILCSKKLPQLPSPCSLSTTFTGFFLCTLHSWSLIDSVCHLTVPLPLPFSIPYCYLKYCFSIMLSALGHLQSHSLMRGTAHSQQVSFTYIICQQTSLHHTWYKICSNRILWLEGHLNCLLQHYFSLNFTAAATDLWVLRCSLEVHTEF